VNDQSNLLVAGLVLILIIARQLRPRPVREERPYTVIAILAVVGLAETASFAGNHTVSASAWTLLALSFLMALGFGALRGATVHLWRADGVLTRQGNLVTIALWVVGLAIHLGIDRLIEDNDSAAKGLGSTALLLYLGITLAAQRVVTLERARRMDQLERSISAT